MSKVGSFITALALALASVGVARGATTLPRDYSVASQASVYPGVEYDKIVKKAGPVTAHVAHVAPGAPVDLRVINAHDKVPTRNSELEATSAMCKRSQCVVAIDGDFHNQGQTVGGVVTGGRMLRSPDPSRVQLNVDPAGRLSAGGFPWSGSLLQSDGSQLAIAGVNVPQRDGAVLYTSDWGSATPAPGLELVLRAAQPLGGLNQETAVELQGLRQGPGPIAPGTAVLSVPATQADMLNAIWAKVQQGAETTQARVLVATPLAVAESIGATPQVLHNGQPVPWPNDPNLITAIQPRTLLAWNDAGDVFMVVVDGRQNSSAGMTLAQAADMLIGLGATEAVNFDGGGGSTFVVGGSVWNQPSDQPTADPLAAERVAANAFVLLAQPGSPPAPKSPPRPGTGSASGGSPSGPPTPPPVLGPPAPTPGSGGGAPKSSGPAPIPSGGPRLPQPSPAVTNLSEQFIVPGVSVLPTPFAGSTGLGGFFSPTSPMAGLVPQMWGGAAARPGARLLALIGSEARAVVTDLDGNTGTAAATVGADLGAAPSGSDAWTTGSASSAGPSVSGLIAAVARPWTPASLPTSNDGRLVALQLAFVIAGARVFRRSGWQATSRARRARPVGSVSAPWSPVPGLIPVPLTAPRPPARWKSALSGLAGTWTL